VCCGLGLLVRFGVADGSVAARLPGMAGLAAFAREQPRSMEAIVGVLLPAILLAAAEWRRREPAAGAAAFAALADRPAEQEAPATAAELAQPARVVGWSLAACAVALLMVALSADHDRGPLFLCASLLAALAAPALFLRPARSTLHVQPGASG
jgi:hypothetical protein